MLRLVLWQVLGHELPFLVMEMFCMVLGVRLMCVSVQETRSFFAAFGFLRFFGLSLSPPPSLSLCSSSSGGRPGFPFSSSCRWPAGHQTSGTCDGRSCICIWSFLSVSSLPGSAAFPFSSPAFCLLFLSLSLSLFFLSLSLLHASVWLGNLWKVQRDEDQLL